METFVNKSSFVFHSRKRFSRIFLSH